MSAEPSTNASRVLPERSRAVGADGGFSLLEIMVALLILMLGLTAVILVFAQGAELQARGKRDMDSARLAQAIASEIQFIAREYETLPINDRDKKQTIVDSHAGFSDQYSAKVTFQRMNLEGEGTANLSYEQAAYDVKITVLFELQGEQREQVYHTAVVVPR